MGTTRRNHRWVATGIRQPAAALVVAVGLADRACFRCSGQRAQETMKKMQARVAGRRRASRSPAALRDRRRRGEPEFVNWNPISDKRKLLR